MTESRLVVFNRPPAASSVGFPLLLAACVIAAGCKKEPPKVEEKPPAEVKVLKIEPTDMPVVNEFVGRTQSSHQVEIRARVAGFLDRRVYEEGSVVEEGQMLFVMDKKPFEVQVNAAAAVLSRQVAAHDTARMNLDRVKPLTALNALSQKDLDDASGNFDMTAAAVEQAKAQLESAKLDLSYCTISSPVKGITTDAKQQDGAYINLLNSHLTTVAALQPMWVEFSVSENEMARYMGQVASGQIRAPAERNYEVETVLVDGSVYPHIGRITFVTPSFSELTGTFQFRATVDNPDGKLRPNQYVRVRLKGAVRPSAMLVPQRALRQDAKGQFLYVVDKDGKAESRPVTVGEWLATDVVIREGLKSGDEVIVDGGMTVRPGDRVHATPLETTKK